jgi:hypothetical protein
MARKKKWISKAVKHPGRLTAAAHRAGVSVPVEAKRWAHSPDKSKRGAGILAERFEGHEFKHRGRKRKRSR